MAHMKNKLPRFLPLLFVASPNVLHRAPKVPVESHPMLATVELGVGQFG